MENEWPYEKWDEHEKLDTYSSISFFPAILEVLVDLIFL